MAEPCFGADQGDALQQKGRSVKVKNCVAIAFTGAAIVFAATPLHAVETINIRDRLLKARKQQDFSNFYEEIRIEFGRKASNIVDFLNTVGFSCQTGGPFFEASCVFAYCGDARYFPVFIKRELMTIHLTIKGNGHVWTGVAHQQAACPATDSLLRQTHEELLTGQTSSDGTQ